MAFLRQTWTLCQKTLVIVFMRHWLRMTVLAFLAPVIFIFFIAYAKNFFVPPSDFGIGSPVPIRTFSEALASSAGGRNTVAFVNNGFVDGDIARVIANLSATVVAAGKSVQVLTNDVDLITTCPTTLRGVSPCFGAVVFNASPREGPAGSVWNYTLRADGAFGGKIFVDQHDNDAEIYSIPIQHAVDEAIAAVSGYSLPSNVQEFPYTSQTAEQRQRGIIHDYMGSLISILGLAYFIGIIGVCYELTGHMASERELGMAQLIEAMMPNKQRWLPQVARLLSTHIAFDIIYLPSWIVMGVIVSVLNYTDSNIGIAIGFFIMAGLALSSWSIAWASLFSKAQLSGITVTIVSAVLAIIIQVLPPPSTSSAIVLSLIFPPMNFTLFIIYMAYWQRHNVPADLSLPAYHAPWRVPGYLLFIFCLIQIIVYPLIGAWIERTLYGTASRARQLRYAADADAATVKVEGLTKYYPPSWWSRNVSSRFAKAPQQGVQAVNDISFSVLQGQIMVLLGANGSGKSTTLDMLSGLQKPTGGSIEMDATGGIGLCPQKNVLWNELTVLEHVRIFNRLKADSVDSQARMEELIIACDLEHKINARSATLSGGQKRKCQLAMMLTGGSSLCMLDEVSSGLDPLSRRKIWDILLAERGRRSMILTTHFLDEADLLSDDITVLSKGRLVASGSAVELKHHLGGGYRVRIYHDDHSGQLSEKLEATPKQVYHDQTVYQLADSAAAARFVAALEQSGITEYQVNGPSIEDVFLKLAEEVKDELKPDQPLSSNSSDVDEPAVAMDKPTTEKNFELLNGTDLTFFAQTWVLFRKRFTILRRNSWPYFAAFLIPIITAGLVTLFLKDFGQLSCLPTADVLNSTVVSLENYLAYQADIPIGPKGDVPITSVLRLYPKLNSSFHNFTSTTQFYNFYDTNYSRITPGGYYTAPNAAPVFGWKGNYDLYYAVGAQNLLDNSLLPELPIVTGYETFNTPWAPSAGKSLQLILYFGLAMSAYTGFFALYTTTERIRNVRALQYSNGVRAGPLWLAYISFDFIIVLLVSAVATIIFTGASSVWYAPGYLFVVFALFGLSATLMSYIVSLWTTSQLITFAFAAGGQCVFFLLYFIAFICAITYSPVANIDENIKIANFTIAFFFPAGNLLRALLLTLNEFSISCRGTELASYPGSITVYGGPILYSIIQSIFFFLVLVAWDSGWKPGFMLRSRHRVPDPDEVDDVDPAVYAEAARVDTSEDELRVKHVTKVFGSNIAVQNVSFGVPRSEVFALLGPNGAGKSTTIGLIRGDTRPSDKISDVLIENVSIINHRAAARTHLGVCPQFDAMDQMTAIEHLRFYARARGVKDVEYNVAQVIQAVGLGPFKYRMASKLSGGNKRKLSLGIALMGNPSVLLLDEPSSGMDAASKRVMWRTLHAVSEGRSLVLTTHSMEEADALADRAGIMAKRMLALGTADQLRKKHGDAFHVHLVHRDAPFTSDADMAEIKAFVIRTFPGAVTEDRVFHGQLRFSVPNTGSVLPHTSSVSASPDDLTEISSSFVSEHSDLKQEGVTTVTRTSIVHDTSKDSKPIAQTSVVSATRGSGGTSISSLFAALEANKQALGFQYYSVSASTLDTVFLNIVAKHNVLEENYQLAHPVPKTWWRSLKRMTGNVLQNA